MKIIICRANEVEAHVTAGKADAVLSIQHPKATGGANYGQAPVLNSLPQKILEFWDTEDSAAHNGPAQDHVTEAFDFLKNCKKAGVKTVIIHCNGGKARSTALALAWLVTQQGDIETAIEMLKTIRPIAGPNILVIQKADEILGLKGKLIDAVERDPLFTENRKKIEERRRDFAAKNPEKLKELYPEKLVERPAKAKRPRNNISKKPQ